MLKSTSFISNCFILLFCNNVFANDFCITKDENGDVIYNRDATKKCKLIRVIDSTKRNTLSNSGEASLNGEPCVLTTSNNYANAEDLNGITIRHKGTRRVACNAGYEGDILLKCNNGIVDNLGKDNACYNIVTVEYMSPRDDSKVEKKFENGESITCSADTFGVASPLDEGTTLVCKVNGYIVAKEGESFTVDANTSQAKYCHASTISFDLMGDKVASISINGYTGYFFGRSTYKTKVLPVGNALTITTNRSGINASGSVVCQNDGTWILGSGTTEYFYTGAPQKFAIPYGAKKSSKTFTIKICGSELAYKGSCGVFKGVLTKQFRDGQSLHIRVGGQNNYNYGITHISTVDKEFPISGGDTTDLLLSAGAGENGKAVYICTIYNIGTYMVTTGEQSGDGYIKITW